MSGRLSNAVAIITGGSGGIGAAAARLFCEQGARVLIVNLDSEVTRETAERIRTLVPGAEIADAALDLAAEESAARAVRSATDAFGRVDVLVNNASIRAYEPLAEARSDTWHRIIAVNLLSYAYLARGDLEHAGERGRQRRQRVLDPCSEPACRHGTVRRHEGSDRFIHAHARGGRGSAWDPGQRDLPGAGPLPLSCPPRRCLRSQQSRI